MKHGFFMVCAFVFLVTAGCPMSDDDDGEQDNPGRGNYAEECWGEWIRMDEDETWYISGGEIKINGEARSTSVSLAKQSDRVIEVREGGRMYYLYASRIANTSFTGKIASFEEASASTSVSVSASASVSPSIQRSLIEKVKADVEAKVKNKNNGSTQTVKTDGKGEFTVPEAIPGDPYEITPEGGTPVTVTPEGDGDDVGTITVTDGMNFKTSITEDDNTPYLYANGTRYDFHIEATNVGTADCLGATYQLSFEDGLDTQASTEKKRWGTIEPGASITIDLSLECRPIEEEYAYKKITVAVTDEINQKTWVDSVTVKFYKVPTYFYLMTESSAAVPVNGVVINPYDNKASRFQTAGGLSYVAMPWSSSGYLVVFSGATIETEAAYALGVNRFPPYTDSDFSGFNDTGRDETNDTEQTATPVTEDSMMAYLHKNDIDYYRYMVPEPQEMVPPFLPLEESLAWLGENAVDGGTYPVIVSGDEAVAPKTLSYSGKTVSITLSGGTAERTVSLSSNGPLFTVESGVTLRLGNNITLRGQSYNTSALVQVDSGATLEMDSGSKISGNTNRGPGYGGAANGGGVQVNGGGTFTMSGGEISDNTADNGGGVYVDGGMFTKQSGGVIYGADADSPLKNTSLRGYGYGHAVYVSGVEKRDSTAGAGVTLDSAISGAAGGWVDQWTVTFDADGGSPATQTRTVNSGYAVGSAMPSDPTRSGYTFGGWYTQLNGGGAAFTASTTVSANTTVYARWMTVQYTVTFDADGGSPATQTRMVSSGEAVGSAMPSDPTRSGDIFGGWYTQQNGGGAAFTASTTVTANITVYAKWREDAVPSGLTLEESLTWLSENAMNGSTYTITLSGDENIGSETLSYGGKLVTIILNGKTAERTVSLSSNGELFSVESGVTLRLGDNITLWGRSGNTSALIQVDSGATLEMVSGSKISGNTFYNGPGGGVFVNSGTFTMNGGEISGNTADNGGGVYVDSGTFTMDGGEISGNTAERYGGGVFVNSGTFTKQSGGVIYGSDANDTLENTGSSGGHAVYVSGGKQYNSTAGEGVTLDSTKEWGWE